MKKKKRTYGFFGKYKIPKGVKIVDTALLSSSKEQIHWSTEKKR